MTPTRTSLCSIISSKSPVKGLSTDSRTDSGSCVSISEGGSGSSCSFAGSGLAADVADSVVAGDAVGGPPPHAAAENMTPTSRAPVHTNVVFMPVIVLQLLSLRKADRVPRPEEVALVIVRTDDQKASTVWTIGTQPFIPAVYGVKAPL